MKSHASNMNPALSWAFTVTDLIFLAYWTASSLNIAGIFKIPPAWMYAHFANPLVIAWNWSFLPIDLLFSGLGLSAVVAARRGNPIWRPLALMSLAFTVAAGAMAVGYWAILREFEPSWFLPNLALLVWPLFFLPDLIRDASLQA